MVREQIAEFHKYYALTHEGTYYRLTPPGGRFCAWAFVDEEQNHALQTLVMTSAESNPLPVHTAIRGLAPDKYYRCSVNSQVQTGRTWMGAGLTLRKIPHEYESVLIEWSAVDNHS